MSASVAAMDARFRQRRIAVLRARGRRRLVFLLALLAAVTVLLVGWGLTRTPLLDVDRIDLQGLSAEHTSDVLRVSGLRKGLAMTSLDTDAAADAIVSLPWVRAAEVTRHWPGTLSVRITPRVPVATSPGGDDTVAVIDAYGYVIRRQPASQPVMSNSQRESPAQFSSPVEVPRIEVPFHGAAGDVHHDAGPGLSVVAALPEDLRLWVDAVTVNGDASVGLKLVGGAEVVLGEPALLDHKVAAVRSILSNTDLECVVTVDVTMADLSTVRRHPMCG